MKLSTCIAPSGHFVFGLHQQQSINVANLREHDHIAWLGDLDNVGVYNEINFPKDSHQRLESSAVYEIRNQFPFWGATYIGKNWADACARNLARICMPPPESCSLCHSLETWMQKKGLESADLDALFETLPDSLHLALATTSTDSRDLIRLARLACEMIWDDSKGRPTGLRFEQDQRGGIRPVIHNEALFEAVANNRHLPDEYKEVMVLRPGVQGSSAIVGDWEKIREGGHVYEYIRGNSYIPFGHYAANMAQDAVRYQIQDLTHADMTGLRHLYYQRTYIRLAQQLGLNLPPMRQQIAVETLESLRQDIQKALADSSGQDHLAFNGSLWGWNFGFDYAPSHYRLHASHQQIHQQFALIPAVASNGGVASSGQNPPAFGFGDMIAAFGREFHQNTGQYLFDSYLKAVQNNQRMDGAPGLPSDLVVYADKNVMLFTPKAQTSQWELQLMVLAPVGNILEANAEIRASLDRAMLIGVKTLEKMGARMITSIEASKRFDDPGTDQRLIYFLLPKTPQSPISFTQAQLRWINGHYPEDFAAACRQRLERH